MSDDDEDYDEERAREERVAMLTRSSVLEQQHRPPREDFLEQVEAALRSVKSPMWPDSTIAKVMRRIDKELDGYTHSILDKELADLDADDDEALNPSQWLDVPVLSGPTEHIPYAGERLDDTEGAILWLTRAQPHVGWKFEERTVATIKLLRSAQRHAAPGSEPLTLEFSKETMQEYTRRLAIRKAT